MKFKPVNEALETPPEPEKNSEFESEKQCKTEESPCKSSLKKVGIKLNDESVDKQPTALLTKSEIESIQDQRDEMNGHDERQKKTDITGKKNFVVLKKVLSAFILIFMWLISGGWQVGELSTNSSLVYFYDLLPAERLESNVIKLYKQEYGKNFVNELEKKCPVQVHKRSNADRFKEKYVRLSYEIYITGKLLVGRNMLKETGTKMKSLPVANKNLTLVDVNSLRLMLKKHNQTCSLIYTGPTMEIMSTENDFIIASQVERVLIGKLSSLAWKSALSLKESENNFKEGQCAETHEVDEKKENFMLYLTARFVINNVQCRGPALNIVDKQQDDPFFIKNIQWHLNPHVKWDELGKEEWSKQNLEENSDLGRNKKEEKIKRSSLNDFHDGNKHVWFFVTTYILLCIIVVAAAAVLYLKKRKKEQGTAIAEEAAETRQPNVSNHDDRF
ncbi:unnamed protein product [Orchesella dallaii]|uniref:Uncharacterized protein n=1 Tax=Orchesella dallaii TaxID=48710 RepID=A0ABP1RLC3_9HEXA